MATNRRSGPGLDFAFRRAARVAVCGLLVTLLPVFAQDPIRLHSDLVVVNVTVTEPSGNYAHGLRVEDFRLLEDGKPQAIDSFDAEDAPFAAAILIDLSLSMDYKFGLARSAAASFVEQIRDDDQVAVYGFSRKVVKLQEFSNSRNITDYIWDVKTHSTTSLYDGLDQGLDDLATRGERRRSVLLISDGEDTSSGKATKDSALKKALANGVTIYTVDLIEDDRLRGGGSAVIGLQRGRRELQDLANQTGGRYVHSPHGDKLVEAFGDIVDELRNQYTLTYYSMNTKRDGRWRAISVGLSREGLTVRARRGYFAPKG